MTNTARMASTAEGASSSLLLVVSPSDEEKEGSPARDWAVRVYSMASRSAFTAFGGLLLGEPLGLPELETQCLGNIAAVATTNTRLVHGQRLPEDVTNELLFESEGRATGVNLHNP